MGKTKKPRPKSGKVNPIGIPSVEDVSFNEELLGAEAHADGPIAALVEQLQSISVEEKMCALQALSVLCRQNQHRTSEIIESDIVKIIASWVMDPNKSIRNATAGALRSLSLCGIEVCENLVEQDVLTPILALLNEYAQTPDWVPVFDKHTNDQLDERADTFLQAINIVWNLCESTAIALENFNRTTVLSSFIRCMDYTIFGFDIAIAVGQTLLVISEDNPTAWRILNNYEHQLLNLLDIVNIETPAIFLSTLAAGILSNVPSFLTLYFQRILTTLAKTLDANHRLKLGDVTSVLPLDERRKEHDFIVTDDSNAMEDETDVQATRRRRIQDMETSIDIEVKHCGWLLEAQRIAAETITNVCSADGENDSNEYDDSSDAESVHDYDVSSLNSSSKSLPQADQVPIEVIEALKSLGIVEKLWQRAQPIAENVAGILKETENGLLKKVTILRISSLLCLQNLCNAMSTEDLGGTTAIYKVWLDLGQQVFQGSQDTDILEAITSLMRAALDHLKRNPELFHQMSEQDLQLILNGVQMCSVSEIRANWLRMLGTLGGLLPEILVKVILQFILETCANEMDVWTISEAVDAMMDMFSDNDWNQIAYELNLVQRSKELERVLKNKLRQQKRDLGERYSAVCTVRTNLSRFSNYLAAQQRKYTPVCK